MTASPNAQWTSEEAYGEFKRAFRPTPGRRIDDRVRSGRYGPYCMGQGWHVSCTLAAVGDRLIRVEGILVVVHRPRRDARTSGPGVPSRARGTPTSRL
jgi:hypothetical protein